MTTKVYKHNRRYGFRVNMPKVQCQSGATYKTAANARRGAERWIAREKAGKNPL